MTVTYKQAEKWMKDPNHKFYCVNRHGDVFTIGCRGSCLVTRNYDTQGIISPNAAFLSEDEFFPLDTLFHSREEATESLWDGKRAQGSPLENKFK